MPKYTVCVAVYVEKYIDVEAANEEEAKELAEESEENSFSLCHHCTDKHELSDSSGTGDTRRTQRLKRNYDYPALGGKEEKQ